MREDKLPWSCLAHLWMRLVERRRLHRLLEPLAVADNRALRENNHVSPGFDRDVWSVVDERKMVVLCRETRDRGAEE